MTCHFFGPESAIFTGYAAARLLGAGSAEVPCPGRSEYAWGTARAQTGVPVPMCRPARYRPEREPEPVLLQAESRETESYAPDVKFKVAAPLRSRADLEVELVLRLLGPIAVVSDAGDHEPDGWVWRVAVAGPLCHEHLEARGRCRTVVTRPVRAARLHVRVLDVLPHGWYRQTSCRWPRATEGHWCL